MAFAQQSGPVGATNLPIIPRPSSVQTKSGVFQLSAGTMVQAGAADPQALEVARYLADGISQAVGREVTFKEGELSDPADSTISLMCAPEAGRQGPQGYTLTVERHHIGIRAETPAGLFYGVQTLRQLLPAEFERLPLEGEDRTCPMPAMRIEDQPRFPWRGLMLDCSRTFLSLEYLKRYVDLLALHKMNVLHLHLADDQGWRVPIEKYPRLTEIGAYWDERVQDGPDGFYTKEQLRELIAYAGKRFVTIVPEIGMPAHCLAALAAYPELACREDRYYVVPYHLMTGTQADPPPPAYGVLCAGDERVYAFVEAVLAEVMALFPSTYIHIGGDECPTQFWKACPRCQDRIQAEGLAGEDGLHSYFLKRVGQIIAAQGRKMICRDDMLEAGLPDGAVVMCGRGTAAALEAARQGHEVILADQQTLDFDSPQEVTPLQRVYAYEPLPAGLTPEEAGRVLGVQAQMWTHIARDESEIDTGIFPRLTALAEVTWSSAKSREGSKFDARLNTHLRRLRVLGVDYYQPSRFLKLQQAIQKQQPAPRPPVTTPPRPAPKPKPKADKPQEDFDQEVDPTAPTDLRR